MKENTRRMAVNSKKAAKGDEMKHTNRWKHPVTALCIGIGVGAVLGILFAPKSGEETREDLLEGVTEGMDEVSAKAARITRGARRLANQTREQVVEAIKAGTEAYRDAARMA
jgi:gas vesicle protein